MWSSAHTQDTNMSSLVYAVDGRGNESFIDAQVFLSIKRNLYAPLFTISQKTVNMSKTEPVGSVIASVSAADADSVVSRTRSVAL